MINHVNQAVLARLVIQSMVNKRPDGVVRTFEALEVLDRAGLKTDAISYRERRRWIYRIFRDARRDGISTVRIHGDDIFLDDDFDELAAADPTLQEAT